MYFCKLRTEILANILQLKITPAFSKDKRKEISMSSKERMK